MSPSPPRTIDAILRVLEGAYRFGVAVDTAWADWRRKRGAIDRLPRPVVSVGNLVVGGAGKTPVVELLAREWLRRGGRPAVLSRGYRAGPDGNDEFKVLSRRLPGVPHRQHPRRFVAGSELLSEHPEIDLFLLDDGFQHRRLHRDLDVVLLDATRPFGFGACLPRGVMREPWTALARADHFVITRSEAVSPHKECVLETFLRDRFSDTPFSYTHSRFDGIRDASGARVELDRDLRYAAFCGIGNPRAFFSDLRRAGVQLVGTREFRDHHAYGDGDVERLLRWGREVGADAFLCTEKDGVKLEGHPAFAGASSELPILQWRLALDLVGPCPFDAPRFAGLSASDLPRENRSKPHADGPWPSTPASDLGI